MLPYINVALTNSQFFVYVKCNFFITRIILLFFRARRKSAIAVRNQTVKVYRLTDWDLRTVDPLKLGADVRNCIGL